jgi:hypothetical protein
MSAVQLRPKAVGTNGVTAPDDVLIAGNLTVAGTITSGGSGGGVDQIIAGTGITVSPVGGTGNVTISQTAGNDPIKCGGVYTFAGGTLPDNGGNPALVPGQYTFTFDAGPTPVKAVINISFQYGLSTAVGTSGVLWIIYTGTYSPTGSPTQVVYVNTNQSGMGAGSLFVPNCVGLTTVNLYMKRNDNTGGVVGTYDSGVINVVWGTP